VNRSKFEKGFSLLEVLVAFSILALTLGVLLNIFGGGIRLAGVSDNTARAASIAQSRLAQVGMVEELTEGEIRGDFDERFRWIVRVQPYEVMDEEIDTENLPVQLYLVNVRVEWDDGGRQRSLALTTLRLAAKEG
jgi:general secretion pathway protein I